MSRKLVIDLATHLGWAIILDNKIILESGNLNLAKEKEEISYVSSKKRKTFPKDAEYTEENGFLNVEGNKDKYNSKARLWNGEWYLFQDDYWYLIKNKEITRKFEFRQQVRRLETFIFEKTKGLFSEQLIVEAPAIPFGAININSIRKQFGLYAIVELASYDGIGKEIAPNEWFKWITNEFPPYIVFNENKKGERKIDRKATSKLIANVIMKDIYGLDKEIKDDNEADAICIAYYEIKNGEEKGGDN